MVCTNFSSKAILNFPVVRKADRASRGADPRARSSQRTSSYAVGPCTAIIPVPPFSPNASGSFFSILDGRSATSRSSLGGAALVKWGEADGTLTSTTASGIMVGRGGGDARGDLAGSSVTRLGRRCMSGRQGDLTGSASGVPSVEVSRRDRSSTRMGLAAVRDWIRRLPRRLRCLPPTSAQTRHLLCDMPQERQTT